MSITVPQLARIANRQTNAVMDGVVYGLSKRGQQAGVLAPHRLAQYIAQIAHESGGFKWDQELWGPTAAQKRYEGRADLGNVVAGDGYRFRGRSVLQLTGRSNYRQFTVWCRREIDPRAPDFTKVPDAVLQPEWSGIAPLFFWETRPSLNAAADQGVVSAVTRIVNGGVNGLADRERYYVRAALVLLGYGPDDIRQFQTKHELVVDGVAGTLTRAALHTALKARKPVPVTPLFPSTGLTPTPSLWERIIKWLSQLRGR